MQIVIRLGSPAGKSILIDSVGALPREGVRVRAYRGRHYAECMCGHKKKARRSRLRLRRVVPLVYSVMWLSSPSAMPDVAP